MYPRWFPWVYFPLLGVWTAVAIAAEEWLLVGASAIAVLAFLDMRRRFGPRK
jgi:hypothetical protein